MMWFVTMKESVLKRRAVICAGIAMESIKDCCSCTFCEALLRSLLISDTVW